MARIGETVKIRLPQTFFACKYRFACSIRPEEGSYRHQYGLRIYYGKSIRQPIGRILSQLSESAVGFVQTHQNLVVVVHSDTIAILNRLSSDQSLGSLMTLAKNSEKVFLVQADGYLLLLPRDFLKQEIPKKSRFEGHLSYEVLHAGALRHADMRYTRVGWVARASKALSREI